MPEGRQETLKKTVKLKLTGAGKEAVGSCEAREITVKAGKSKAKFDLVRDTADCKPGTVDLSRAGECDFIGSQQQSLCMVPFPDDFYTRADPSSATGRRIDFKTSAMPANDAGVNMAGKPYNLNDGFSPGSAAVVRIPGIDTQLTSTPTRTRSWRSSAATPTPTPRSWSSTRRPASGSRSGPRSTRTRRTRRGPRC